MSAIRPTIASVAALHMVRRASERRQAPSVAPVPAQPPATPRIQTTAELMARRDALRVEIAAAQTAVRGSNCGTANRRRLVEVVERLHRESAENKALLAVAASGHSSPTAVRIIVDLLEIIDRKQDIGPPFTDAECATLDGAAQWLEANGVSER